MKKALLLFLLVFVAMGENYAQHYTNRNKIWAFGRKGGLDFTSGTPVPRGSKLNHSAYTEGCASVCDTAGNLLFYTDGRRVYNKNNVTMPSGFSIVPFQTFSSTQAALIIPVIGSPFRYYLFSMQELGTADTTTCQLSYCIVDMALDGGLGDIVPSSVGTPLNTRMAEKMIAIPGSNDNVWLMTHRRDTAIFLAYEITSAGINTTPVVSSVGKFSGVWGYAAGVLKVSPNWQKIVSQNLVKYPMDSGCTELYDFNRTTGLVSNCIMLDSAKFEYGAEFSPDNSKLYTSANWGNDTMEVFQYNLALASTAAIKASKTLIHTVTTCGCSDLKLGPDNKIYLAGKDEWTDGAGLEYSHFLDCISSPNLAGLSCTYIPQAITLPDTMGIFLGLPNLVVTENPTSGINNETDGKQAVNIYPNPATTEIFISATMKIENVAINNVLGIEVFHGDFSSENATIGIGLLPAGIYMVRVNGQALHRFLKL